MKKPPECAAQRASPGGVLSFMWSELCRQDYLQNSQKILWFSNLIAQLFLCPVFLCFSGLYAGLSGISSLPACALHHSPEPIRELLNNKMRRADSSCHSRSHKKTGRAVQTKWLGRRTVILYVFSNLRPTWIILLPNMLKQNITKNSITNILLFNYMFFIFLYSLYTNS